MISIDLTEDEAALLRTTLDARRRELLHEIHHTDDRAFRELLRHKETMVERVYEKLTATGVGGMKAEPA